MLEFSGRTSATATSVSGVARSVLEAPTKNRTSEIDFEIAVRGVTTSSPGVVALRQKTSPTTRSGETLC